MNFLSEKYKESLNVDFIAFKKLIKLAGHIIEEIEQGIKVLPKGEKIVEYSVESMHELEMLSFESVSDYYDGLEDIPGMVFALLESYLQENFVSDDGDTSSLELTQRSIVFAYYARLGELIGKNVQQELSDFSGYKLLTDERSLTKRLENPTLDVLSILLAQSHKKYNKNYDSRDAESLDFYMNLLYKNGIITEDETYEAITTNDPDRTLYEILQERIFGIHIPLNSHLYEWFQEYEKKYKSNKIHALTRNISDTTLNSLHTKFTPEFVKNIIGAFEFDIIEIFDKAEFIESLKHVGLIGEREEWYFQTMTTHRDLLHYLIILLNKNEEFWEQISTKDAEELYRCFEAFDLYYGEYYANNDEEENMTFGLIRDGGDELINKMIQGKGEHYQINS